MINVLASMRKSISTYLLIFLISQSGIAQSARNLLEYCPSPQDQGNSGACNSYALALSMSILENIKLERKDPVLKDSMMLSPSFIYNKMNESSDCKNGLQLDSVIQFAITNGVCRKYEFHYFPEEYCHLKPKAEHIQLALKNKLIAIHKVFDYTNFVKANFNYQILKDCINRKSPVLISARVKKSFYKCKSASWKYDYSKEEDFLYLHAMVLVGYDDLGNFMLMSSWGNQWGKQGIVTVDEYTLSKILVYAYSLEKADVKSKQTTIPTTNKPDAVIRQGLAVFPIGINFFNSKKQQLKLNSVDHDQVKSFHISKEVTEIKITFYKEQFDCKVYAANRQTLHPFKQLKTDHNSLIISRTEFSKESELYFLLAEFQGEENTEFTKEAELKSMKFCEMNLFDDIETHSFFIEFLLDYPSKKYGLIRFKLE